MNHWSNYCWPWLRSKLTFHRPDPFLCCLQIRSSAFGLIYATSKVGAAIAPFVLLTVSTMCLHSLCIGGLSGRLFSAHIISWCCKILLMTNNLWQWKNLTLKQGKLIFQLTRYLTSSVIILDNTQLNRLIIYMYQYTCRTAEPFGSKKISKLALDQI